MLVGFSGFLYLSWGFLLHAPSTSLHEFLLEYYWKGVYIRKYANHDILRKPEFHGLDPEILQKALAILVKRGKAQVFGQEDQQGVKFF